MPARRFFAMLGAMRILDAREKVEQCDIAAIPMCTPKHYENVRGAYEKIESREIGRRDFERGDKVVAAAPSRPALSGDEAKYFMMSIFASKKGRA